MPTTLSLTGRNERNPVIRDCELILLNLKARKKNLFAAGLFKTRMFNDEELIKCADAIS